jgi:hypothetical protein
VEVISLILANPAAAVAAAGPSASQQGLIPVATAAADRSKAAIGDGDDVQPQQANGASEQSRRERQLRACAATLIVTPAAILQQWVGEIEKHSSLKVKQQCCAHGCLFVR